MIMRSVVATVTLGLVAGSLRAEDAILNIYNWSDYIEPALVEEFELEYGIQVNYDIYDSSEMVDTKLMTGSSGYDIVFHSASFAARLIDIGVFQAVDFSRLENFANIDPEIMTGMKQAYGAEVIGVPYMWGTTGFSYNVDMLRERLPDAPIDSSALVFDPEVVKHFADCGVSLLDDPTSVIPFAMMYLGYSPGSVEPTQLAEVEELMRQVRPYIKYFSSTKMLLDLPSREVCIAMSWSGDYSVATLRAEEAGLDINLAYSVPKEGAIDWYDLMFIPSDAPHPDAAHLFIDYMLRPEVIARATNFIGYANANRAATKLVDPRIANDPAIYPDAETRARLKPSRVLDPKRERRRSRSWTKIKSGL